MLKILRDNRLPLALFDQIYGDIYDSLLQVWVATTYGFVSALGQGIALIPTMTIGKTEINILEAFS